MLMTKRQFAEKHNIDYTVASNFIKFLQEKGLVKLHGEMPAARGKGKPSEVFDIPSQVTINLENWTAN